MAKYVRCSNCGKKIYIGDDVYTSERAIFCDAYCFAEFYLIKHLQQYKINVKIRNGKE